VSLLSLPSLLVSRARRLKADNLRLVSFASRSRKSTSFSVRSFPSLLSSLPLLSPHFHLTSSDLSRFLINPSSSRWRAGGDLSFSQRPKPRRRGTQAAIRRHRSSRRVGRQVPRPQERQEADQHSLDLDGEIWVEGRREGFIVWNLCAFTMRFEGWIISASARSRRASRSTAVSWIPASRLMPSLSPSNGKATSRR